MQVSKTFPISLTCDESGCSVEHTVQIGQSSWDDSEISIRNRYDRNGHFSPRSSSEIPIGDIPLLVAISIREKLLTPEQVSAIQAEISKYNAGMAALEFKYLG